MRRDAAVADILTDVRTTLTNAIAREGDFETSAETRLPSVLTLSDGIKQRLQTADAALAPAIAALDTEDAAADALIGRISDEIWNLAGRPANDPALDILFPGGTAYDADGNIGEQPERMELLSQLLDSGVHARLPSERASERAKAMASELRSSASKLRERVATTAPLRTQITLAERMHVALGRSAHAALAALKRVWKADGRFEAEIHTIIPDRPAAKKAGPGAKDLKRLAKQSGLGQSRPCEWAFARAFREPQTHGSAFPGPTCDSQRWDSRNPQL